MERSTLMISTSHHWPRARRLGVGTVLVLAGLTFAHRAPAASAPSAAEDHVIVGRKLRLVASVSPSSSTIMRSERGRFELELTAAVSPSLIFQDGFESSDLSAWSSVQPEPTLPSGAVVFAASAECPSGFSELAAARGRAIVGVPDGGTTGGALGASLADRQRPAHAHLIDLPPTVAPAGGHNHQWSRWNLNQSALIWWSWISQTTEIALNGPDDDIDNEGDGQYPFVASVQEHYYTQIGADHTHTTAGLHSTSTSYGHLPYVQLIACEKD